MLRSACHVGLLGLSSFALLVAGCGGGVGKVVQPKDFTGAEALGGGGATCKGPAKLAKVYTVDLDNDTRGDLEIQMGPGKGVVVVAYDCTSLRVLPSCSVGAGSYDYAGIQLKEEVVRLKGSDELKATLPVGAAKLSAEMKAGRTLDLGLVEVGRRATTVSTASRAQLTGECQGATHIMRRASVGAFSLATGSEGKAAAVADVFGASASGASASERTAGRKDGSVDACKAADAESPKPPKGCASLTRIELVPIAGEPEVVAKVEPKAQAGKPAGKGEGKGDKETAKEIKAEVNACPAGFESAGGACTARTDVAHLCKPGDELDCRAQCEKGSAESCTNAGALIRKSSAHDAASLEKAKREAQPLFKKACDLGHVEGCTGLAIVLYPDEIKNKATLAQALEAIAVEKSACLKGSAEACVNTAVDLSNGSFDEKTMPPDEREALKWAERGCALGSGRGCELAAQELYEPRSDLPPSARVKADPTRALALAIKGCDGGGDSVCVTVAEWLVSGKKVPKDAAGAVSAAKRACMRDADLCTLVLPEVKKAGDDAALFAIAKHGCEKAPKPVSRDEPCLLLGDLYTAGSGTAKDPAKARDAWKAGCDAAKEWADKPQNEKVCKRLK